LDAESVKALYVKFSVPAYRDIPIWYVISHASSYAEVPLSGSLDWKRLKAAENELGEGYIEFLEDLDKAVSKLKVRKCKDETEDLERNEVVKSIKFDIDENVFLIDSKYSYKVKDLFTTLFHAYANHEAIDAKNAKIKQDIQYTYIELKEILEAAHNRTYDLASLLHNNCSLVTKENAAQLRTIRIAAETASLSQKMYAQLRESPLRVEMPLSDTFGAIDDVILRGTESPEHEFPEVIRLKQHIKDMKKLKNSADFILLRDNILINQIGISNQLNSAKRDLVSYLKEELSGLWETASLRAQAGEIVDAAHFVLDHDRILNVIPLNAKTHIDYIKQNAQVVSSFLNRETEELIEMYDAAGPVNTIFRRQQNLLQSMGADIPSDLEEAKVSKSRF
jgi:hypothetical protein